MKLILLSLVLSLFCIVLNAQPQLTHPTFIAKGTYYGLSKPLRDLPVMTQADVEQMAKKAKEGELNPGLGIRSYPFASIALPRGEDQAWQKQFGKAAASKAPIINFEGQDSPYYPPDCNGTVGPNHYMQTVNCSYTIYSKTGAVLAGPTQLNLIFGSVPGANRNDGDPIILYDDQADRWLVTEFSIPSSGQNYMLMAVSETNDPTGAWHQYSFPVASMPDYPKFGIWQDGYYMGDNNSSGNDIYVFERAPMLTGATAQVMGFNNPNRPNSVDGFMCVPPVDNDGPFAPAGSPGLFIAFNDDAFGGGVDELWIYELAANWTTPSLSTFGRTQQLPVQPFDSNFGNNWSNITQKGTSQKVDAIPQVIMNAPQYRNFGSHQTLVCCHTVDVDGTNHAGIRWYELQKTTGDWTIRQQSTYAPDANNRWMGSISMNAGGNIGIGYSVSSSTMYPSIRYCGQTSAANVLANGVLDYPEMSIFEGSNSQSGADRWGDYSKISLDPLDDGTFWFTTEYIGGGGSRKSKVAAFTIGIIAPLANFSASNYTPCINNPVVLSDQSTSAPISWLWSVSPSSFEYLDGTDSTSQNPHIKFTSYGSYTISLTATNAGGDNTITKPAFISVNPVNAAFHATATTVVVGSSTIFYDESTCDVASWSWNFGDGASPATANTQGPHVVTYSTSGLKTVTLTVNDTLVLTKTDYVNVIDPSFNMTNASISACSGNFYDPGGSGANYGNNQDYVLVLYPGTPGNMAQVDFSAFNLESGMFCANDYLKILNGNSISSPVMGVYCSNTSPGTKTASNASGALTFIFHSNNAVTLSGWNAAISCIEGVGSPLTLNATPFSYSQIDLTWVPNVQNNGVMLVYSPDGVFGSPVNGSAYQAGDNIAGGGIVLYAGSQTSYSHMQLQASTLYHYRAYSYDASQNWSYGVEANATTLSLPAVLITPMSQTVAYQAGTASFDITTNNPWAATSDVSWCSVTPSGNGTGVITASYQENTGPVFRTANLTVTLTGLPNQVLQLIQLPSFVSVPEASEAGIMLFPNPTSGIFTISGPAKQALELDLDVYDSHGSIVMSRKCSGSATYAFNLSSSPKGLYFVTARYGEKNLHWKMVLK
ncbi:MAG: PKD domain-containing protein [Bacteroidetes bacterium]|nr:PKD domain-containing protein [Bacteroidota bacterium]